MARFCLCAWVVFGVLLGCCARAPVEPAGMLVDPLLGEFTVFERLANGFIESRDDGGRITIEKRGEDYILIDAHGHEERFTREPATGRLVPAPGSDSAVRWIEQGVVGNDQSQSAVLLMQSFQVLYLVRGVGPAAWWDERAWRQEHQTSKEFWDYSRQITHRGTRSERIGGNLKLLGEPIEARAGDILFTPIGKFMYFGQFDESTWTSGWLDITSTMRGGVNIFNEDGSLTLAGAEYRAAVKRPTYKKSYDPMSEVQLEKIVSQIKPGMTENEVDTALRKYLSDRGAILANGSRPVYEGVRGRIQKIEFWHETGMGRLIIRYKEVPAERWQDRQIVMESGVQVQAIEK